MDILINGNYNILATLIFNYEYIFTFISSQQYKKVPNMKRKEQNTFKI